MTYPLTEITQDSISDLLSYQPAAKSILEDWIETSSNKWFHYLNPWIQDHHDPASPTPAPRRLHDDEVEIDIRDIISGLAHETRFHGQFTFPASALAGRVYSSPGHRSTQSPRSLSVAEHSLFVWSLGVKYFDPQESNHDLCLGLLLHDAHEAYVKDISPIMRNILKVMAIDVDFLKILKHHIQERILERFEVTLSPEEERIIKVCDRMAFLLESWLYMPSRGFQWKPNKDFLFSADYETFKEDLPRNDWEATYQGNGQLDLEKLYHELFFHYGAMETIYDQYYWTLRAFDRYGVQPE